MLLDYNQLDHSSLLFVCVYYSSTTINYVFHLPTFYYKYAVENWLRYCHFYQKRRRCLFHHFTFSSSLISKIIIKIAYHSHCSAQSLAKHQRTVFVCVVYTKQSQSNNVCNLCRRFVTAAKCIEQHEKIIFPRRFFFLLFLLLYSFLFIICRYFFFFLVCCKNIFLYVRGC